MSSTVVKRGDRVLGSGWLGAGAVTGFLFVLALAITGFFPAAICLGIALTLPAVAAAPDLFLQGIARLKGRRSRLFVPQWVAFWLGWSLGGLLAFMIALLWLLG